MPRIMLEYYTRKGSSPTVVNNAMKNPLISVIVPVYKVEQYLEKCVDSLLRQTYPNLEIILVDDGSPDACPAMCDALANANDRITAYHKANGGLGSARNYGVERARGDWIVFVDSDDCVLPEYISDMWTLLEQYGADFVTCGITAVDEADRVLSQSSVVNVQCMDRKDLFFSIYFGNSGHRAYAKLFPKAYVLAHPFPRGYFEDFACMYLIASACKKAVVGNAQANYRYLQRDGSILNRELNEKHLHAFEICDEIVRFINVQYPEFRKYEYLLYQKQLIQIFNRQRMSRNQFDELFKLYRNMFRKNLPVSLFDRRVRFPAKCYTLLLCLSPGFYLLVRRMIARTRQTVT